MKKCRPSKWVPWALVGAGLPLLAAAVISTDGLKSDVAARAFFAVAAEQPWAKIELSGRDATISGESPSAAAAEAVAKAVANTYGVRTVVTAATVVEPIKLIAPTIESITATSATPEIKGTWPEGVAKTLAVTVAGTTYNLPGSPELTSNAGNWTLKLAQPLPAGENAVTAVVSDGATVSQAAEAPGKIMVEVAPVAEVATADTMAPVVPVVSAIPADAKWPYAISGTFDEVNTKKFSATLAGREYVLGRGAALTSDGKGTFTFAPSAKLPTGAYDIDFTAVDAAGNASVTTAKAAINIAETAAVVAAPEVAADVVAPMAPVVSAIPADAKWPYAISGTFDEVDTKKFSATLAGREYVLGRGAALTSDGKGAFTFAPSAKLPAGTYDIDFAAQDAAGNVTKFAAPAAVVVADVMTAEVPPATPVVEAPAIATIINQLDLTGAPIIKGTWSKSDANTLSVAVGGKTYELGKDANIASDDQGNWRLMPSAALPDGTYDVVATTTIAGTDIKSQATGQIAVDATPPVAPVATAVAANASPTVLTGTYDAAQSKTLKVSVPELNLTAELGAAGSPLTADAGGNWSLALPAPLVPGTYSVVVTAGDEHGRMVEDASTAEVVVTPPDAPVPAPVAAYDCEAVMTRINAVFPMRFVYDTVDFAERFGVSVNQYAALLKDPRCATIKVEVGGHADERGPDGYNENLAERRATVVRDMMVAGGVDSSRLTIASYGEVQPMDNTGTEDGWAINRRVEIKILK